MVISLLIYVASNINIALAFSLFRVLMVKYLSLLNTSFLRKHFVMVYLDTKWSPKNSDKTTFIEYAISQAI